MRRLVPISRRQLIKKLGEIGFEGPFSGGKHQFMSRGELDVHIPNPHASDIGVPLLKRILKQADVSQEEWSNGGS